MCVGVKDETLIHSLLCKSEQQFQLEKLYFTTRQEVCLFLIITEKETPQRNHTAPNINPSFFCQKMNIFSFTVL